MNQPIRLLSLLLLLALSSVAQEPPEPSARVDGLFYRAFYTEVELRRGEAADRLYREFLQAAAADNPLVPVARKRLAELTARRRATGSRRGGGWASAEEWKRRNLIQWQRNLADAEHLSRLWKRPLLICVNMDGEVACERFAGRKYKDPEFVKLVRGFVPLIISPDRHNPKDYDARGRRIPCPRFGCVTCGEHIAAEKAAFKKYFGGKRYAPRHIGVGVDGKVLFDHYMEGDLSNVDRSLAKWGAKGAGPLVVSPYDSRVREHWEARFLAADGAEGLQILQQAQSLPGPYDLLRLGLAHTDAALRHRARLTLAAAATEPGLSLVVAALRGAKPEGPAGKALRGSLERMAKSSPVARRAFRVRRALEAPVALFVLRKWDSRGNHIPLAATDDTVMDVSTELDALYRKYKKEKDLIYRARAGELHLRLAMHQLRKKKDPTFHLHDAIKAADQGVGDAAMGGLARAVLAVAHHYLRRPAKALENAGKALPWLCAERPGSELAHAVLEIFAKGRTAELYRTPPLPARIDAGKLAEAHRAWLVVCGHRCGTENNVKEHLTLLAWLGAHHAQGAVLRHELRRKPASAALHEKWRSHLYASGDPAALAREYEYPGLWSDLTWRQHAGLLHWFAGLSTMMAAEEYVRREAPSLADQNYVKADKLYDKSKVANSDYADSCNHYRALILAARSALAAERGEHTVAVDLLLESRATRPATFKAKDGLGRTPAGIGVRLKARLEKAGATELVRKLEAGLQGGG